MKQNTARVIGAVHGVDRWIFPIHDTITFMALTGDEYLLVCLYVTEANNISGIVVCCVTKMLRHH